MEYIEGYKINDSQEIERNGWNKAEIANIIIHTFSDQIFKFGFVHADPHPGNVFIRSSPKNKNQFQIVLLDHGLYSKINDELRLKFAEFWVAVVNEDNEKIKKLCEDWKIVHHDLFASLMMLQSYDGVNLDCLLLQDILSQSSSGDGDDEDSNPISMVIDESHLSKVKIFCFLFLMQIIDFFLL